MRLTYIYSSEDGIWTGFDNRGAVAKKESPQRIYSPLSGKIQCDGLTYETSIYRLRLSDSWVAELSIDGGPLVPCGHNYISDEQAWETLRTQIEFCSDDFDADDASPESALEVLDSAK